MYFLNNCHILLYSFDRIYQIKKIQGACYCFCVILFSCSISLFFLFFNNPLSWWVSSVVVSLALWRFPASRRKDNVRNSHSLHSKPFKLPFRLYSDAHFELQQVILATSLCKFLHCGISKGFLRLLHLLLLPYT